MMSKQSKLKSTIVYNYVEYNGQKYIIVRVCEDFLLVSKDGKTKKFSIKKNTENE